MAKVYSPDLHWNFDLTDRLGPRKFGTLFRMYVICGVFYTGTANKGPKNLCVTSRRTLFRVPLYRSSSVHTLQFQHFRISDSAYPQIRGSRSDMCVTMYDVSLTCNCHPCAYLLFLQDLQSLQATAQLLAIEVIADLCACFNKQGQLVWHDWAYRAFMW